MKQSYSRIAKRILRQYPQAGQFSAIADESQLGEMLAAVKRWLEHTNNTQWLMIFDNYDNPKIPGMTDSSMVDIRLFLPEVHYGSIIITTRSAKVKMGQRIRVTKMVNVRDSLQILSDASCRDGVMDGQ